MKHSPEEWKEIIKEFKESGLSQRKWCAIHDEDRNRLQYWILRFQYLELGSEIMFAEINVGGGGNDTDTPEQDIYFICECRYEKIN